MWWFWRTFPAFSNYKITCSKNTVFVYVYLYYDTAIAKCIKYIFIYIYTVVYVYFRSCELRTNCIIMVIADEVYRISCPCQKNKNTVIYTNIGNICIHVFFIVILHSRVLKIFVQISCIELFNVKYKYISSNKVWMDNKF